MADNIRNAGRKPCLTKEQIEEARLRRDKGESVKKLSEEFRVSRQTMSAYLSRKEKNDSETQIYTAYRLWAALNREFHQLDSMQEYHLRMEFMCEDKLCSVILVNFKDKKVSVINKCNDVLHRAFGVKVKPTWEDFQYFLESRCFPRGRDNIKEILKELELDSYDPLSLIEKTKGRMAEDKQWIRLSYFRPEY